jgi:hypothetical protein
MTIRPDRRDRADRRGAGLDVDQRHLAEAVALAERAQHLLSLAGTGEDLHAALEQHEHLLGQVTLAQDDLAGRVGVHLGVAPQALEFGVFQAAEDGHGSEKGRVERRMKRLHRPPVQCRLDCRQ